MDQGFFGGLALRLGGKPKVMGRSEPPWGSESSYFADPGPNDYGLRVWGLGLSSCDLLETHRPFSEVCLLYFGYGVIVRSGEREGD